jgi:hypothetical protein
MDAYCAEIRKLEGHFEGIEFQHVPHNNNVAANILSKPTQTINQAVGSGQSRPNTARPNSPNSSTSP